MAYSRSLFARFLLLSTALHLALFLSWPSPSFNRAPAEPFVSVSVIPALPEAPVAPPPVSSRAAPSRPSKAPAIIAKKSSPILEERAIAPSESSSGKQPRSEEPSPREAVKEKEYDIMAERRLPTVKELLPAPTWSSEAQSSGRSEGPLRLDTRNPQYITYFGSIKRAIESVWQYPALALKYGLQGRLLMEFTILGSGQLEDARIVRSSGSNLLDDEALRAVKAAAPFSPIPSWIGKNRIEIIATFEYHDNRLNYRFTP